MEIRNLELIDDYNIDTIPWKRLYTAYGIANEFPDFFSELQSNDEKTATSAYENIAELIENQSTLWHVTPFAIKVLCDILIDIDKRNVFTINFIMELFIIVMQQGIIPVLRYWEEEDFENMKLDFMKLIDKKNMAPKLSNYHDKDIIDLELDKIDYINLYGNDSFFENIYFFSYKIIDINYDTIIHKVKDIDNYEFKKVVNMFSKYYRLTKDMYKNI